MPRSYRLSELAEAVGGEVRGEGSLSISGVGPLETARPDQITWVSHERYVRQLSHSQAGAVVISHQFGPTPMPAILCADPTLAFSTILGLFAEPPPAPAVGVHPTAVIAPSARVAEAARIGAHVIVGEGTAIGRGTVLHPNVCVADHVVIGAECVLWPGVVVRERCRLGDRVILHPNVTIGADGFGYHFADGQHNKIPQIGTVVIEDDVEIGAGSCVDRAKFGETVIGRGTKIDNLVQVAHNVRVGPHCVIVALSGIAGSSTLGSHVVLGGKVGVRDHVELGEGVRAAACCCISKDVPAGTVVNGIPAIDNRQYLREQAQVRRLPELAAMVKDLAKRVAELEAAEND